MTPEEQRIAIAEACGWTEIHTVPYQGGVWGETAPFGLFGTKDSTCVRQGQRVPNYLNDLNAMSSAEETLTESQQDLFGGFLYSGKVCLFQDFCTGRMVFRFAHAPAAKRAEAFLRAIGKWKE